MSAVLIKNILIVPISLFVLLNQVSHSTSQENKQNISKPKALFQDIWAWLASSSPETATSLGINDYDEFLTDYTEGAILKRRDEAIAFVSRAEGLEKDPKSSETDLINLRAVKDKYQPYADSISNQSFYFAINKVYGMHRYLPLYFKFMPLEKLNDYEVMLKRMEKIPTQISQIINLMKEGVKKNITYHHLSMDKFNSSLKGYIVTDPKECVLHKIFTANFSKTISQAKKTELQNRSLSIIKNKVTPAFERLAYYITREYKTRPQFSVASVANGKNYYQHRVKYFTSTNLTPQEIHNIGLKEVARIESDMKKIIKQLGFTITIKEFLDMIIKDPNNYHNSTEEVLASFRYICRELIPPKLPKYFSTINNATMAFTIKGDPLATSAYYFPPSLDAKLPGTFFVPTSNQNPKFSEVTLSIHEVSPGHHFHYASLPNYKDFELFRRTGDQSFFSEGWALYAEKLGKEMGLYEDPYDLFGHYTAEMFRACRLVVDTGLHHLDWSPEKAIDYMVNRLAKPRGTIVKEVTRYLTNPGQALSYKIGEIKIVELRRKAENVLSDKFNIKEFHDIVLSSYGGSLKFVEERVDKWIKQKSQ